MVNFPPEGIFYEFETISQKIGPHTKTIGVRIGKKRLYLHPAVHQPGRK